METAHTFGNIHAVLVHESPECVADLVANLRYLDPTATVLLYDGTGGKLELARAEWSSDRSVIVHPAPRQMEWGRLHDFAVDALRFALTSTDADTVTIVDSDQLAVRAGYSAYLGAFLRANPDTGMLASTDRPEPPTTRIGPPHTAWRELELWNPLLERFAGRRHLFPRWTYWPSTVFTRAGARAIVDLWDDPDVQHVLAATRMWATEEIVLPALVTLAGLDIVRNPCSYDYVRFRRPYTTAQAEAASRRADVFWLHPVLRRYDDPVRAWVRARYRSYGAARSGAAGNGAAPGFDHPRAPQPLTTLALLRRMEDIPGWLSRDEADLLAGSVLQALSSTPAPHHIVGIGSYCGRSTFVAGRTAQALDPHALVHAVDPYDGTVSEAASRTSAGAPTFPVFLATVAEAGLGDVVIPIKARSSEVDWHQPVCLLFIDGRHDYAAVAADFSHFAPFLVPGALVAFRDYSEQFPGVQKFVDHLLATGAYEPVSRVESMALVRRVRSLRLPSLGPLLDRAQQIRGWFEKEEAALLALATSRALGTVPDAGAVVEVGSYCGRATVVLAQVAAAAVAPRQPTVVAIDTFDGVVGSADTPLRGRPTLTELHTNLADMDVDRIVETLVGRASDVPWDRPIAFLLIDGLHDYQSVAADFARFERHLQPGGLLAFHDYAVYWPDVRAFVAEVERTGAYRRLAQMGSLIVLEKSGDQTCAATGTATAAATVGQVIGAQPSRAGTIRREPLVSCIMPTFNRRAWVARAVTFFLRQDYEARELIVVDDGSEPVGSLLPADSRVRYIRLEQRTSIGTKRNIGCERAGGEIIAHWDDDDWFAPWRLRYQVEQLLGSDADLVGLNSLLYWEPQARRAWRYRYPMRTQPWIHDPTFCYRRELWQRCPFPDTSHGIDTQYLWQQPRKRVTALGDPSFYVGIIHAGNTSTKQTSSDCWQPCPRTEIEALLGDDVFFDGTAAAVGSVSSAPGTPGLAPRTGRTNPGPRTTHEVCGTDPQEGVIHNSVRR